LQLAVSAAKSLSKTFTKAADEVPHSDTGTQFIFSGSCGCEQQFVALPVEFQEGMQQTVQVFRPRALFSVSLQ